MSKVDNTLPFPLLGEYFNHRAIERLITNCRYDKKRFAIILARQAKYRELYLRLLYLLLLEVECVQDSFDGSRPPEISTVKPFLKLTAHPAFVEYGKKNLNRADVIYGYFWPDALQDAHSQLSRHFVRLCYYLKKHGLVYEIKSIPVLQYFKKTPRYQNCRNTNNLLLCCLSSLDSTADLAGL